MRNNLNILDCTFRDGGHYNNWNFDEEKDVKKVEKVLLNKSWNF